MQAKESTLTVLTVSHGHGSLLLDLLESLESITDPSLQWLCLLNIPEEKQIRDRLFKTGVPLEILENDHPKGLAFNLNKLLKKTTTESFLIVNPDVVLPPDNLKICQDFMHQSGSDLITCPSLDLYGNPLVNIRYFPTPSSLLKERLIATDARFRQQQEILSGNCRRSFWFQGSYLMGKTETARSIGFNEIYPLYFEDVEFCANYWKRDLKLSICQATHFKHHFMRKSSQIFSREMLLHCISAWRYFTGSGVR